MNNYWYLHDPYDTCKILLREGKVITAVSSVYEIYTQKKLFNLITEKLSKAFNDAEVELTNALYTHENTIMNVRINKDITRNFKQAWITAGLPPQMLSTAGLNFQITTNDIGTSAVKLIMYFNVGEDHFLIGDVNKGVHKKGGINNFETNLKNLSTMAENDIDHLAKLIGFTCVCPKDTLVNALRYCKIDKLSLKSCRDLVEGCSFFSDAETAYTIYTYMHSIFETAHGKHLSEDIKFRIILALKKLLKADWNKLDNPSNPL